VFQKKMIMFTLSSNYTILESRRVAVYNVHKFREERTKYQNILKYNSVQQFHVQC
jgi:hypothetical protein